MNMTKKREKPALMPQSNYSTEILNKKNMVKLLMQFCKSLPPYSQLDFSINLPSHRSCIRALFLFLLSFSDSTAYFGLYVKAPKEKEVM